jgi:hypothetical protein
MKPHKFDVKTFLDEQGVRYSTGGGGREFILSQCPTCGKSNKFYISADEGKFICFSCVKVDSKMRGGPIGLVMLLADISFREAKKMVEGREFDISIKDDHIASLLNIEIDSFNFHQKNQTHEKSRGVLPDPIRIPRYMLKIDKVKFPEAWNYLKGRGITDESIQKMEIYISGLQTPYEAADVVGRNLSSEMKKKIISVIFEVFKAKVSVTDKEIEPFVKRFGLPIDLLKKITDAITTVKYRNRIVFCVSIKGYTFGWVARDYTLTSTLKVMNSPGPFKYFCLWNFDQVENSSEIVVCEGIVSAVKCGLHRGVATLGKMVTDEQLVLLQKTKAETIYICLDVDAQSEAIELKRRLLASFKNVYNISLPPVKLVKCSSCGTKNEFDLRLEKEILTCNCGFELKDSDLRLAVSKSEYKDSGDYSSEEMDVFINQAKDNDHDSFLLGSNIFDD